MVLASQALGEISASSVDTTLPFPPLHVCFFEPFKFVTTVGTVVEILAGVVIASRTPSKKVVKGLT
jgi:hypothetical protein